MGLLRTIRVSILGSLKDVGYLLHPYHILNFLFAISYLTAKLVPSLCQLIFPLGTKPEMSTWETQIMYFLIVTVMFRTRKSGNRNLIGYVTSVTYYGKACNAVLWGSFDPIAGLLYVFAIMAHFVLVGEPVPPKRAENITHFAGLEPLNEALESSPDTIWLIAYYATWAGSTCNQLAPIYSDLSNSYSLPHLKFGKVDVGRYPAVAEEHKISTSTLSRQLPSISLFKGKELLMRRPNLDNKGRFNRFYFTEDNIVAAYDLNNLYAQQKSLKSKSKGRPKTD